MKTYFVQLYIIGYVSDAKTQNKCLSLLRYTNRITLGS